MVEVLALGNRSKLEIRGHQGGLGPDFLTFIEVTRGLVCEGDSTPLSRAQELSVQIGRYDHIDAACAVGV